MESWNEQKQREDNWGCTANPSEKKMHFKLISIYQNTNNKRWCCCCCCWCVCSICMDIETEVPALFCDPSLITILKLKLLLKFQCWKEFYCHKIRFIILISQNKSYYPHLILPRLSSYYWPLSMLLLLFMTVLTRAWIGSPIANPPTPRATPAPCNKCEN